MLVWLILGAAAAGLFFGLPGALLWMTIVDEVNKQRPPDDQIPVVLATRRDVQWWFHNWFPYPKILKEHRRLRPSSRTRFWLMACWGLLLFTLVLLAGLGFLAR